MITSYRYMSIKGWQEQEIKYKDDYILGAKTKRLLNNIDESLEILRLLQEQTDETQAESMDVYFDESATTVFLTVKLYDDNDDLIKVFNVEHSIQKQDFILLLEFLQFNAEHDINVYTFKGQVAERMNEYVDECYDLVGFGRRRVSSIKPR